MTVQETDALIIVDVQNTFCPGGNLPVPNGDKVVAPINRILPLFPGRVYATMDWHPENHCSFVAQGGIWPPHAVQGTKDAELHPDLNQAGITEVFQKATTPEKDSYSAFEDTGLADELRAQGIQRVFVTGLATDYCVKASALDAKREGFETVVLTDAMRAVEVTPGDGERAIAAMETAGCDIATTSDLTK